MRIKTAKQVEGFVNAHLVRQGSSLQRRADDVLELSSTRLRIEPANAHAAAVWSAQPFENLDRARLPSAVRAQQAENFSLIDGKAHPAQRFHVAVTLGQVVNFNRSPTHHESLSITQSTRAARTPAVGASVPISGGRPLRKAPIDRCP